MVADMAPTQPIKDAIMKGVQLSSSSASDRPDVERGLRFWGSDFFDSPPAE